MRDIGHLEFGLLHKPINFPEFIQFSQRFEVDEIEYWLGYWLAAARYLIEHAQALEFVLYDQLADKGQIIMTEIVERAGLSCSSKNFTSYFRGGTTKTDRIECDAELLAECSSTYDKLTQLARNTES